MAIKPLNTYNLGSFTLATQKDKKGSICLVATNKASNFSITWGADTIPAAILPESLNTVNGADYDNTSQYIELMLNMAYFIANTPLPVEAYNNIIMVLDKYISFKGVLPDELPDDELEQDLALAHAAEDASTKEKIDKLTEQAINEFKNASKKEKGNTSAD